MKKFFVSLLLVCMFSPLTVVLGLSWAYPFVVYDGKVYQVTEEQVPIVQVEENIGRVTSKPDRTGEYYGNASNKYPIDTKYFSISDIPVSEAIAVEEGNVYVKAIYQHEAPFHWMNVFQYTVPILFFIVISMIYFIRERMKTKYLNQISK
ncbi:hypothetical protein [Gracilibacillus sp. YIM 98692]|uniref:hypothetical protein n=1 Tax=Gracilibacillus sp. YIM 98692 TaxID=2663532 RepID=UPI0013D2A8CE|nr:hypothetical protein [Gracilibacillus sp. YIM 98692]